MPHDWRKMSLRQLMIMHDAIARPAAFRHAALLCLIHNAHAVEGKEATLDAFLPEQYRGTAAPADPMAAMDAMAERIAAREAQEAQTDAAPAAPCPVPGPSGPGENERQ